MNWIYVSATRANILMNTILISSTLLIATSGCGVKGMPLPPEEGAYIGRGQDAPKTDTKTEPAPELAPNQAITPAPVVPPTNLPTSTKKKPAKSKIKQ